MEDNRYQAPAPPPPPAAPAGEAMPPPPMTTATAKMLRLKWRALIELAPARRD